MRGKFITVEGTEGVGKSTNMQLIENTIKNAGIEVLTTREPGGTPLAEELRAILLADREEPFNASTELLVMFAARAQHLNERILPALERGCWVLCDRFTDATFAYQGYGRGVPLEDITALEDLVQKGIHPDKTFLLDADVQCGIARAKARAALDRFEKEKVDFFEKVRKGYHARVKANPQRYCVINAENSLEQVQKDIVAQLELIISNYKN